MANSTDVANINLETRDIIFNGDDLGLTTVGSVVVNFGETVINIDDADQLTGIAQAFSLGMNMTVTTELKRSDYLTIFSTLLGSRAQVVQNGGKTLYFVGTRTVRLVDIAGELALRVTGSGADRSRDAVFFKCAPVFTDVALTFSRDAAQVLALTWQIYPDPDRASGREVASFGDPTTIETDPDHLWISTGTYAHVPEKHLPALTLNTVGHREQVQCFEAVQDNSSVTASVNEASGIATADVSFDYDGLSGDTILNGTSSYILINSEVIYMSAVTASSATAGTVDTASRGVWDTTATGHANNDTITVLENIGVAKSTDTATWASSSSSLATVGDTFGGTGASRKGTLEHVAAGAPTITATRGATVSPVLTVTTA